MAQVWPDGTVKVTSRRTVSERDPLEYDRVSRSTRRATVSVMRSAAFSFLFGFLTAGLLPACGGDAPSDPDVEAEREVIARALEQCRWNRVKAAKMLKISYRALLYKIKDMGLKQDSMAG